MDDRLTHLRTSSDADLVQAIARDDRHAWVVLLERVRPPMEEWAWRSGIPREDWPECIDEVIEDVVLRIRSPSANPPTHLVAYFLEAARLRHRMMLRARHARLARLVGLADGPAVGGGANVALCAEHVVSPLVSDYARRGAWSAGGDPDAVSAPLAAMAAWVRDQLSETDQRILGWQAYGVPHRRIAEWLGTSYDAATKRVWRLTRRARAIAERYAAEVAPLEDRAELSRFFQRARGGAAPAGMLTPAPARRGAAPRAAERHPPASPKEPD